jgi:hypothetical protein
VFDWVGTNFDLLLSNLFLSFLELIVVELSNGVSLSNITILLLVDCLYLGFLI